VTEPDGVLLQHITDWMVVSLSLPNLVTLRFFVVDSTSSGSALSDAVRIYAKQLYELPYGGWPLNVSVLSALHTDLTDRRGIHPLEVIDRNRRRRLPFNRG
jgi:hypothetical protein